MKKWMGAAVLLTGLLGGCGGDENKKEEISPADANAVMQAVLVKINGTEAELLSGAPPPTSASPEKPVAKIDGGDVSVGAGGAAAFDLVLTPELQAAMCAVFVKVSGADTFVQEQLGCGLGKAIQLGTPLRLSVSIKLPPDLGDGRFCVEMSGRDSNGLTSNVAEVCINVSDDAGSSGGTGNLPPVAQAGPDRTVSRGQTVTLSGAGSGDTDGHLVAYQWQQISGVPVVLQNANSSSATFVAPAEASDLVFTLSVTDDDGDQAEDTVTISSNGIAGPTVTLTVNPASVVAGASATLQWSSSNATSCTASGAWSGSKATSGNESVSKGAAGSYVYTLTCNGASGTTPASDTATLTVTPVAIPNQPAVTISVTPSTVSTGQSATLQWTSTNATACTASGAWSGSQSPSGSQNVSHGTAGTYAYTLTCSGASGTTPAQGTATLTVTAAPQPTVDLTVAPTSTASGQTATLQWTSTNATACTASGAWSGSKATSGSENTSQNTDGAYTYTLTCDGAAGSTPASDSAILTVSGGASSSVIHSLSDATEGANPYVGLVEASDGNLYGATCQHGTTGDGTIFRSTTSGAVSVVHNFVSSTDGECPRADLIRGTDGNLYGTTWMGGAGGCGGQGCGSAFRVALDGTFAVLHSFQDTDGNGPTGLVQASDGNFYGTTLTGGTVSGLGVVFKMTSNGTVTPMHTFTGGSADGAEPWNLMQASDGILYGVTRKGGPTDAGTLYKITTAGVMTTLRFFDGTNVGSPVGKLVEGSDGMLYGTADQGASVSGAQDRGALFRIAKDGTGFEILHKFLDDATDGDSPDAGMIFADGLLYGTTVYGGLDGKGVVFRMAPDGTGYTVLYSFEGLGQPPSTVVDGENPEAGLVQASDGNLYGTTRQGGTENVGVIYRIGIAGSGFVTNPANGHTYRVVTCGDWTQCETQAQASGEHLVAIDSLAEKDFLVGAFGGSTPYWIGLSDQQTEGTFVWSSGEPLTYQNWGSGEPNNGFGGNEDFAYMNTGSPPGLWNDLGPSQPEWSTVTMGIFESSGP